jgi:hypothetical protein
MAVKSARLQTNLVGRKVHLLTDAEAQEDARQQGNLDESEIDVVTAERWYPIIGKHRKQFGDQVGEIVTVYLRAEKGHDEHLIYTIAFGGVLVELQPVLWRLEPQ